MKLLAPAYIFSRISPSPMSQKCTELVAIPAGEPAQYPEGLLGVIQVGWEVLGYSNADGSYIRTTPVQNLFYDAVTGSIEFVTKSGSLYRLEATDV